MFSVLLEASPFVGLVNSVLTMRNAAFRELSASLLFADPKFQRNVSTMPWVQPTVVGYCKDKLQRSDSNLAFCIAVVPLGLSFVEGVSVGSRPRHCAAAALRLERALQNGPAASAETAQAR